MRRLSFNPRKRTTVWFGLFIALLIAVPIGAVLLQPAQPDTARAAETPADWRKDWALANGFSLSIDSQGYEFPSAIAFVPNPGKGPKDPLYFVTELRGALKVVSNDRTVTTFAKGFVNFTPEAELPSGRGQGGMAGVCLDPKHGYVFTTFIYQDSHGSLRNNIMRFTTTPGSFGLEPTAQVEFTDLFAKQDTGLAHQIGPCHVKDDLLYVSVGEGWQPAKTQDVNSTLGKILRMTLDGKPVADNPFYHDDTNAPRNYVWALGLRNPFGMSFVGDRMFVGDNGNNIDRFLQVERGQNYLWNGNDASIATNADFVFVPSIGPAQMDFLAPNAAQFPEPFRDTFYLSSSSGNETPAGVIELPYAEQRQKLASVPNYFLKYIGDGTQMVAGLAFGPDGLYVAPLFPDQQGQVGILKIAYDPANQHPYDLSTGVQGETLVREKGCVGCHRLDGGAGYGGSAGPPLTRETLPATLSARLNSPAYLEQLAKADAIDAEPQNAFRAAREELRKTEGMERVRTWIKYRVMEPRFDNTSSQMPNLGLSEVEAEKVADFLMEKSSQQSPSLLGRAKSLAVIVYKQRLYVAVFVGGIVLGVLGIIGWNVIRRRRTRPT